MTANNDQAAVEALCKIKHEIRGRSVQGTWSKEWGIGVDGARAILAAIRAGRVPGVCADPAIAIATAYQCAEDALAQERDALRAEVDRLKVKSSNYAALAETARRERDALAQERNALRAEVERLKALVERSGEIAHAMEAARDQQIDRAEKAKQERDAERARADKAVAERDEARAERDEAQRQGGAFLLGPHADLQSRFDQAVALLLEARELLPDELIPRDLCRADDYVDKTAHAIDAFLAGQPAPGVKPVVDDAMVERACAELRKGNTMRVALVAALEGKT